MIPYKPAQYAELFRSMIENIQQRWPLKAVILFGTRARGTAIQDSDYDLVIVADFTQNYLDRVSEILKLKPHVALDVFCYTPTEFKQMFQSYHVTVLDAIGEGRVLFGDEFFKQYKEQYNELTRRGMKKVKGALLPPELAKIYDENVAGKISQPL